MIRDEPTVTALKKVAFIAGDAGRLGWSDRALWTLACALEDGEELGDMTEAYIEIVADDFRQFFMKFETIDDIGQDLLGEIAR